MFLLATGANPYRHPEVLAQRASKDDIRTVLAHPSRAACGGHLRMTWVMGCYVYMLRCADGSFYIGSATGDDLARRTAEHQTGAYRGYTFSRRPITLV